MQPTIPSPLIAVVAELFSSICSATQIESRFLRAGFNLPVPEASNKQQRVQNWLIRANHEMNAPLAALGRLIQDLMEVVPAASVWGFDQGNPQDIHKERVKKQLATHGLIYQDGGHILQIGITATSRTLQQMATERDLLGIQREFERIVANIDADPGAALTASCALLEALFKSYIADEKLTLPSDQSILPLWKLVRSHLKLDPGQVEDEGLRKVLSGLASIVDGIASLRTKRGSAHGHDTRHSVYRIEARHARC